jgi:hypothetical protein
VSGDLKLSEERFLALKKMGFCDPTYDACDAKDDGVVSIDDQSAKFTGLDGYREAFMNLSNLGGQPKVIDSEDFVQLANAKILGEIIAGDPAYGVIKLRRTALEFKHKEVKPADLRPGIPPRHYKRLAYYLQMALAKLVDKSLVPDGIYGEDTRAVVEKFQKSVGIEPDDGTLLGPRTVGTLIMRCRYSRTDLVTMLEQDKAVVESHGPFIIDNAHGNGHKKVKDHLVIALKWLGYIDESTSADSKFVISKALSKNFDGATLVGPIVLGWVIDRIKGKKTQPNV